MHAPVRRDGIPTLVPEEVSTCKGPVWTTGLQHPAAPPSGDRQATVALEGSGLVPGPTVTLASGPTTYMASR